jgi:hypothetical protein
MQDDDGLVLKKKNKPVNSQFIIDFMAGGGKPNATVAVSAPNAESIAAAATIIVSTNWPSLTGFNLYRYNPEYDYDREFLMHVPAMQLMTQFAPEIQKACGAQIMKGVIPVVPQKAGGEDLKKLSDEAKKDGRNLL